MKNWAKMCKTIIPALKELNKKKKTHTHQEFGINCENKRAVNVL